MLQKIAFQKQVTLISNYWLGTMSNNNIRKSLIASAFVGAFMFGGVAQATTLADITSASAQTTKASAQSQEKINNIYDQSQELLADYRALVEQT
ncbi:MAG: DUF3450 family protein [Rheinheimera sp.]